MWMWNFGQLSKSLQVCRRGNWNLTPSDHVLQVPGFNSSQWALLLVVFTTWFVCEKNAKRQSAKLLHQQPYRSRECKPALVSCFKRLTSTQNLCFMNNEHILVFFLVDLMTNYSDCVVGSDSSQRRYGECSVCWKSCPLWSISIGGGLHVYFYECWNTTEHCEPGHCHRCHKHLEFTRNSVISVLKYLIVNLIDNSSWLPIATVGLRVYRVARALDFRSH